MTGTNPGGGEIVRLQVGEVADERSDTARTTTSPEELRQSAELTLRFGRGLLRNRWAYYYAAWALAVTCYFLVPKVLGGISLTWSSPVEGTVLFVGLLIAVTLGALTVSYVTWGLAERTFNLHRATYGSKSIAGRETIFRYAIVAAVVIGVVILAAKSTYAALLAVDTILVVLSMFLTRHLGRAFHPIPIEGCVATGSFLIAAGTSYVSLVVFGTETGHTWAWFGAVLVWFGCAAYARFGPDRAGVTT